MQTLRNLADYLRSAAASVIGAILLFSYDAIPAERGLPLETIFGARETPGSPQHWSVAVAEDGLVYWVNRDGIIEYDGREPRMLPSTQDRAFFRARMDPSGNLWVGGRGEIGLLTRQRAGGRDYRSLLERIPIEVRDFGFIREIVATRQGVFFQSRDLILRIDFDDTESIGADLEYWQSSDGDRFRGITEAEGEVLIVKESSGLLRLDNGQWKSVPQGGKLAGHRVVAIAPATVGLVVCSENEGILRYADGNLWELSDELQQRSRNATITNCRRYEDGRYAFSSLNAGAVVFSEDGIVLEHFAEGVGLPVNWVSDVPAIDKTGGWWFALGTGMARLAIDMPIRRFSKESGLSGNINVIKRVAGQLYVGTSSGLYVLKPGEETVQPTQVEKIGGTVGGVWGIASLNGEVIISSRAGIGTLDAYVGATPMLIDTPSYDLIASPDGSTVYGGTANRGLQRIVFNDGRIRYAGEVLPDAGGTRFLKLVNNSLWMRLGPDAGPNQIARIPFDEIDTAEEIIVYGERHGLPVDAGINLTAERDTIKITQHAAVPDVNRWFLSYDLATDRFAPAPPESNQRLADLGANSEHGNNRIYAKQFELRPEQEEWAFFSIPGVSGPTWYDDSNYISWSTHQVTDLMRFEFANKPGLAAPPQVLFRAAHRNALEVDVFPGSSRQLPFSEHTLRIEYSLDIMDGHAPSEFRTRAIGLNDDWSDWETSNYKEYASLREGSYRFEVQGRDPWNRLTNIAALAFTISPPWWRTLWAYLAYIVTAGSTIFLYVRRRAHASQTKILALQAEIDKRELAEYNYQTAFEQVPSALILVRLENGEILDCNAAFEALLGRSKPEIIGSSGTALNIWTQEEHKAAALRQLQDGEPVHELEVDIRAADGSIHECRYSTAIVHHRAGPVFLVTIRDLTETRESLRVQGQLQRQLQHLQTLEDIGTLSSGIAHDFGNLQAVITMYAKQIADQRDQPDKVLQHVGGIEKAGQYAKDLVTQLLAFSRPAEAELREIDIGTIVADVERFLRVTLPKKYHITYECDIADAIVVGNATQIQQILLNIGANSVYAMPSGGNLTFSLQTKEFSKEHIFSVCTLAPGEYYVIRVSDTGSGIDPDLQDKIFEPFFTTKAVGSGSGLGLSTVREIMLSQGGGINVRSSIGKGTVFELYWPILPKASQVDESLNVRSDKSHQHILVVDDNQSFAVLYGQVLESEGYDITICYSTKDAFEKILARNDPFSLILCDLSHRNAEKFIDEITEVSQSASILILAARVPVNMSTGRNADDSIRWLVKPVTPSALNTNVAEILDKNQST